MPTTCNNKREIPLIEKINNFKKFLNVQSFILLARPKDIVYESDHAKKKFIQDLTLVVDKGLLFLEIPWVDNINWFDLMSDIKSKFPHLQINVLVTLHTKGMARLVSLCVC